MPDSQIITIFKALSDTTRLSIVRSIARSGCEISCADAGRCSELSQPTKSHHFKKLVEANVLTEQKRGKEKYYCINHELLQKIGIDTNKL